MNGAPFNLACQKVCRNFGGLKAVADFRWK